MTSSAASATGTADAAGHQPFDTDVLVVGSGPMGSTTALALAR